ncbi:hypothetical protein [Conexibacter arvalis]|uniref:hypothetical protein n=1 Tax=Conexibacter arvalis TaxID=912552 RepID=UPI001C849174|nr:hypothetical protein [Conexibacter arvalis]
MTLRFSAAASDASPPMMSAVPAASEAMRSFVAFIEPTISSRTAVRTATSHGRRRDDRIGSYLLFWTFAKKNPRVCYWRSGRSATARNHRRRIAPT